MWNSRAIGLLTIVVAWGALQQIRPAAAQGHIAEPTIEVAQLPPSARRPRLDRPRATPRVPLFVPQLLRPDRARPHVPPRRPEARRPRQPPVRTDRVRRPRIECIGGNTTRRGCVCPRGTAQRSTRPHRYVCVPVVVTPPHSTPPRVVAPHAPRVPPLMPPALRRPPVQQPPRIAAVTEVQELADEVLATFPATTVPTADAALAQRLGLQLIESATLSIIGQRIVRLRIPDGRSPAAVVAAILADAQAVTAQPNYIYRQQQAGEASPIPQYALTKVAIDAAHRSATGRGVTVAVIDSGVDPRHPDLEGAVLRVHDLFDGAGATELAHGTAITGIIVARGQTRGVAPATDVLSVRAFQSDPSERSLRSSSFVILKAIDWSVNNGARVLNLSFAGARDPLFEKAVAAIAARRIIMVAAAGNGGRKAKPAYPGAYPDVIAVTATDARDRRYEHANVGGYVALAAPGVEVLVPNGTGGYDLVSGTSFAAAYISGIAALLLELEPSLEPEALLRLLQEAAVDLGAPGIDPEFGAGLANAAAALTALRK